MIGWASRTSSENRPATPHDRPLSSLTYPVSESRITRHLIELGGLVVKSGVVDLTGDSCATISIDGAPFAGPINNRRGVPLIQMENQTLPAIEIVSDEIDALAAMELWKSAVSEKYMAPPVWLHGDLKADNLLTTGGKMSGLIDWGLSAVGDPTADYASAWSWVAPPARETFRQVLGLNDVIGFVRKRGLSTARIALSYYRGGKAEPLCQQNRLTLSRLGLLL